VLRSILPFLLCPLLLAAGSCGRSDETPILTAEYLTGGVWVSEDMEGTPTPSSEELQEAQWRFAFSNDGRYRARAGLREPSDTVGSWRLVTGGVACTPDVDPSVREFYKTLPEHVLAWNGRVLLVVQWGLYREEPPIRLRRK
jgi:hypothetical protein